MEPLELPPACACPIGSAGTSCSRKSSERLQPAARSFVLSLS